MKIPSKKLRSAIIYYVIIFLIILAIHIIFKPYNSKSVLDSMMNSYGISTVITEEKAISLMKENTVEKAVSLNKHYILKMSDGSYYCVEQSKMVDYALNLSTTEISASESKGSNISIWNIVFYLILIVFIIKFILELTRFRSNVFSNDGFANMTLGGEDFKESDDSVINSGGNKKITFDDVQGIDELKPDLYRLVDCLKNPQKYADLGARMTKGVILHGPPGTGKTLTAKAIAGEAGVPFFSMCGSDFMEKYVGVGAARIRELYKKAKKAAPCIVFIDEIDAIGGGRGEANNGEKDQTINALLAELDGFNSVDNILTICATNRLDILDPALMRPGRFDLKLAVGLPDKEGRLAILKLHSKNKKLDETVSLEEIAKKTIGFSGAGLENLMNEAALIAADKNKQFIDKDDIEDAFFKIIMEGNKKKRKDNEDFDAYLTAYHEAGHTLATKLLTNDGVTTVTIIQSTSGAGGVTFTAPDENNLPSKKYLRNQIKVDYAGRAAEELYLGNPDDITTGASQDIRQATSIIKSYIGAYGMGDKGLIDIKQLTSQFDIVEEATKLSNELYSEVLELLKSNYDKLKQLADALVAKETLYEEEIDEILGIRKKENEEIDISKN